MSEQHRATPEQWDAGEALYRFAAWLVARDQPLVISGHHDASPLVDLLDEWLATHGIEKPRPPVRPPIQIATPEQWQQVENWVHRELDESLRPLLSRLAAAEPAAGLTDKGLIDCDIDGNDQVLLKAFYAAAQSEGGSADEVTLRGLHAVLALPKAAPTNADLLLMWREQYGDGPAAMNFIEFRDAARAVLARYAHQPPQPIPLSERLPGPEDCDAEGRCWQFDEGDAVTDPAWNLEHRCRLEEVVKIEQEAKLIGLCERWRLAWLPHHALPLPEAP